MTRGSHQHSNQQVPLSCRRISNLLDKIMFIQSSSQPPQLLSRLRNGRLREDSVLPIKRLSWPIKLLHWCRGSSRMLIPTISIVGCKDTRLTIPISTIHRDTTWFLMLVHMSLSHILGIKTLTIIMHSNSSSLRLRINKSKYKDLRFRLLGS